MKKMIYLFCISLYSMGVQHTFPQTSEIQSPLYIKITVIPIFSLARYDINIDTNLVETRIFVILREGSSLGRPIENALVEVNGDTIPFKNNIYEKRRLFPGEYIRHINCKIALPDSIVLQREFTIPTWLRLTSPIPAIFDTSKAIDIAWEFLGYPSPVNVFAYNFKTGDNLLSAQDIQSRNYPLPADKLKPSTLLRIYVIEQWTRKQTLSGDGFIEGSGIEIIPWSQVFIRIEK